MNAVYPDEGLTAAAQRLLSQPLTLRLFVNDVIPKSSTTTASLTEATFAGYAVITLLPGGWTYQIVNDVLSAVQAVATFTNTSAGSVQVFGFYYLDIANNLFQAIRFDGAPITIAAGGSITVIPTVGCFSSQQ